MPARPLAASQIPVPQRTAWTASLRDRFIAWSLAQCEVIAVVVICGLSAWEYWRTPPQVRDGWMDPVFLRERHQGDAEVELLLRPVRANAREGHRSIRQRLLCDLKGLSLPVEVMTDNADRASDNYMRPHRLPKGFDLSDARDLGGGLYVLTPSALLLSLAAQLDRFSLLKIAYEACGIFTISPRNKRVDLILSDLEARGVISPAQSARNAVSGYADERGVALGNYDAVGEGAREWQPAYSTAGRLTDIWKRPPLCTVDELRRQANDAVGCRGRKALKNALEDVLPGAASPLEVYAALLLCADRWTGGEALGHPALNRRITFDASSSALAHQSCCYADQLWDERSGVLELQGIAYHVDGRGDRGGYGRTLALESMGYSVAEVTYDQLSDLEKLDVLLPVLARKFGLDLKPRTPAFLRRREALHEALFSRPYEPGKN